MTQATALTLLAPHGEQIYAKLEYSHPSGSAKHRALPGLVATMLRSGEIDRTRTLVIRSAGAAAITAAFAGAQLDLRVHAVVPISASAYVINALRWYGASCERLPVDRMNARMQELANDASFVILDQAGDVRLLEGYARLGEELLSQQPDAAAVVVGLGTGLTAMGIHLGLRRRGSVAKVFGVEPSEAAITSGRPWAPHHIPGLAPPLARPLLRADVLDRVFEIASASAWQCAREVAKRDGLPLGPSSGAVVAAARRLRAEGASGPIVAVCACSIDAYLDVWDPDAVARPGHEPSTRTLRDART
jgi:cysteine synthase A